MSKDFSIRWSLHSVLAIYLPNTRFLFSPKQLQNLISSSFSLNLHGKVSSFLLTDIPASFCNLKKSADNWVVGKKVFKQKLPSHSRGEKIKVARKDPIALIPPVRILDGIRIDVPAAVVPVHVDRAQHASIIVHRTICTTARQIMTSCILFWT